MKKEELMLLDKQLYEAVSRLVIVAADLDERGQAGAGTEIRKQAAAAIDAWSELRSRG